MRTMKETTYDAIKQGKMLGGNKFNYELKIEGYDEGYGDVDSVLTNIVSNSGVSWADFLIREDGKVIYVYQSGVNIYVKIIESENIMMSVANSGAGGTFIYSVGQSITSNGLSLIRLKNGKILLLINDMGNFTTVVPAGIKVFESTSGLGTDFILKVTLGASMRVGTAGDYLKCHISKPAQHKDESILFTAWERRTTSGYDMVNLVVYKSIDGGLSWVKKYTNSPMWSNRWESIRSMVIIGDVVFVSVGYIYADCYAYILMSTDKGETWVMNGDPSNIPKSQYGHELIDFSVDSSGQLFMILSTGVNLSNASIYKAITTVGINYNLLNTWANWVLVRTNIERYYYDAGFLSISSRGTIHFMFPRYDSMRDTGLLRTFVESKFKASQISISKSRGGANTASIRVNNKDGVVNPRNPDGPLYGILKLNRKIIIKQGYGDDIVESFTGIIDSIKMSTFPQVADIALRDNLKLALDQKITKNGINTIDYTNQPIENIVRDLCICAGLEIGYIEPTGISIEKSFSWESYADAFQFLSDLASFEFLTDEVGKFHFRRDYQPNNMFVAWSFEEGVDITNLTYEINDNDLYYAVKVYGKAADDVVIIYDAPFLDAPEFNILPQKILKIDATEASSHTELKKIAERAISTMRSRTRVIDFSTVGVPHLQIGDFIQLFEKSTGSADVYRLSSMALNMSEKEFTMNCKAYYYGDSVVPIELPNETETQTANATLNLIPEMTSNVAPSGVARASSVYILYTNDYKPWNAFNSSNADLFWDASVNHGWIEYEFPKKMVIDKYMVKARQLLGYNDAMPKAWTFEAFDGTKWIVLDTRSAQTGWGVNEQRSYTFVNTVAYPKYRLNVSGNNGYSRMQIEQLAMYFRGGV